MQVRGARAAVLLSMSDSLSSFAVLMNSVWRNTGRSVNILLQILCGGIPDRVCYGREQVVLAAAPDERVVPGHDKTAQ